MTAEPSFVHLHVHSEYSLLDGAARIEAPKFHPDAPTIFTEAARHGMSAVAVTDHGAMFGALRFFEAGRAAGIKPIIGVEAYVAPGSRFERNPGENEEKYHHLTLLAENETGYRNLLKLVSAAYLEGFYHRPRMDKELLAEHAEGVICLSGCLSSELSTLLLAGQDRRAQEAAGRYRDIFGPDRFFMELQDHGIPDQRRVLPKQIALARSLDIPLVATNDLHYTVRSDAKPHDVLLCIQQQKLQSDPKRLKFDSEEFYLKSAQEMRRVFHEAARGVRQHAADRRARRARPGVRGPGAGGSAVPSAAVRDAGSQGTRGVPARARVPGRARSVPHAHGRHPPPDRRRAGRHHADGVRRATS